jgi:hypothetical protein
MADDSMDRCRRLRVGNLRRHLRFLDPSMKELEALNVDELRESIRELMRQNDILTALNREQGTALTRLINQRAEQDAIIARFVKETHEQSAGVEVGRQETSSRDDASAS